jgi:hypothetical protein
VLGRCLLLENFRRASGVGNGTAGGGPLLLRVAFAETGAVAELKFPPYSKACRMADAQLWVTP